jgi:predicted acetyltransferase
MAIVLRPVTADELHRFHTVEARGFGDPQGTEAGLALDQKVIELDRTIAAFDGDQLVGTNLSFAYEMTVPGGETVAVGGVSGVTVAATHRRRGILRDMMTRQLDDIAGRGEAVAILNASESSIYGRFGYGLANLYQSWSVDVRRAGFRLPVRDDLRLRILDRDTAKKDLAPIYDSWRRTVPGALSQSDAWWDCVLAAQRTWRGGGDIFVVVCEPGRGHDGGYVIYTIDNSRHAQHWILEVRELVAVDPDVEARLWRYVLDVDLVGTVTAEARPMDDPLRWRLTDPRQVRTTLVQDYLYVRLLDIAAAFSARRYPVTGSVVVDVVDPFRPDGAGRYEIAGAPDASSCEVTAADAELRLDVADLGSLLLGGVRVRDLARTGRVTELAAGAVDRADAFFGWPVAPFCTTRF